MRYRKKAYEVEAFQWDGSAEGARGAIEFGEGAVYGNFGGELYVSTPLPNRRAEEVAPGDWIVKIETGDFIRIPPNVFAHAYEPVPDVEWEPMRCARCGSDWPVQVPAGNPNLEICGPCHCRMLLGEQCLTPPA